MVMYIFNTEVNGLLEISTIFILNYQEDEKSKKTKWWDALYITTLLYCYNDTMIPCYNVTVIENT